MKNTDILKQAYQITISNPVLWLVGMFLSSGFNFHLWYFQNWLERTGVVAQVYEYFSQYSRELLVIFVVISLLIGLLIVNYVKLIFLNLVHDRLHDSKLLLCWLCKQRQDNKSFLQLNLQKILSRTLLVSFITVILSLLCISLFSWYFAHSYISLPAVVVVFFCLLILLVTVSLWSLFMVISIFWYNMNFADASKLAFSLLFLKVNRVFSVAFIVTFIFLLSVSVGGIIIWQIPRFFDSGKLFFFTSSLTYALNTFTSVAAIAVFFIWLTIHNVWFNVAMIILYNNLVKSQKTENPIESLQSSRSIPSEV
jgi:hypothetical protein